MDYPDHDFDWKGFGFAFRWSALCLLLGIAAYQGPLLLIHYYPTTGPASAVTTKNSDTYSSPTLTASPSSVITKREINSLAIADVIPNEGKLIVANLADMRISLYDGSTVVAEYPIVTKGKPGTPWETPSGFYEIETKERDHYSTIGHVFMPYSMQFYGNYFIHGRTYYPDGTLTSATFSGGCIKLSTEDAKEIFNFAEIGTKVFVYDPKTRADLPTLNLGKKDLPAITTSSYLIADIDTGDVYAEQDAQVVRPIASITKLMTALVANETISFNKKIEVSRGGLENPPDTESSLKKIFVVGDLFYPLLMQSSNSVADSLAYYYGKSGFIDWMNTTAKALGMNSTVYADASGASSGNISTPDDLFRLAAYLADKKSFIFNITHTPEKKIVAIDGSIYNMRNLNAPVDTEPFIGGKAGHTTLAKDTMLSVLSLKIGDQTRRVAIIVLGSDDRVADTSRLAEWITASAKSTATLTACASCAKPSYRKIELPY